MNTPKQIQVKILRTDPAEGRSHFQTYSVPFAPGLSVTNVLQQIWEDLDPSLAFYVSCHSGKCRGCFVKANGKVRMACATLVEGDLEIKPWPKYEVIKDLVVDLDRRVSASEKSE